MKARIYVTLKPDVLDPQGKAVFHSLQELGYSEVADVRIGRFLEIELTGEPADARLRLDEMCRRLLANPVIEDFRVEPV
ncbi:MAG: phosphoribosylformylglycinamidine synthase subunit PurS [Acidobacteria bacterium]|nr:phosphoribosylformylglycinamidine synthase subunit PurS [Acidobacteriota bacterium]MCZ6833035.1 phosphoribosylformylglycinamidine synthase subunit PurS [Acidobacteriota bacterium]